MTPLTTLPFFPPRYSYSGKKFSGGQGDVYLCRDANLERDVAIKFVKDIKDFSRLMDEINALQRVRSKNVIEIYDLLIYDGGVTVAVVDEYVDGDDLLTIISAHGRIADVSQLILYLFQIASGVADVHAEGIIHRDIKPNNMKMSVGGIIKIFDFGLAKLDGPAAATIGFKGTPGFAAPELFGTHVKIEKTVDVYAFGATACYLAVGELPTEINAVPPAPYVSSLASLRPDLPGDVAAIIDRCLAWNPADRPSMDDVRDLLARHILADRHQGLLAFGSLHWLVSQAKASVNVDLQIGSANITYTGFEFVLTPLSGDIYVNYAAVTEPTVLPGASVITFGGPHLERRRKFVTFDISHPEVML